MIRTSIHLSVYVLLICCALMPLMAQSAASADSVVPAMVRFAGTVTDVNGKPLTGTVGVTFLLYTEQSGGAPLWTETQNVQPDKNGHYSAMLGSTTSHGLPADAFAAGQARWIGVQPSGQAEQPRVELGSVPYALKAADAQTLGGLPPSAFLLATPSASTASAETAGTATSQPPAGTKPVTTAGGTAKALAKFDGTADIANSQIFDDGTNVGVGTKAPKAKLDVKGDGIFHGTLTLPATGAATATAGQNSQPLNVTASAFNSGTTKAVNETFRWQAEPAGNNTANPSGRLNLLFGSGGTTPSETGLSVSGKGLISFAPGQTFPGSGNGTVTSVGLSAPNSDFSVSGSPVTGSGTLKFQWLVPPTADKTPNAIVKRDDFGNFTAGGIFADTILATSVITGGTVNGTAFTGGIFAAGIVGTSGSAGGDQGYGVTGTTQGGGGAGVFGQNTGGGIGVRGFAGFEVGSGQGVLGESLGTLNSANGLGPDGVDGIAHSTLGSGVGGFNDADGFGVLGRSTRGQGVWGESFGNQNASDGFGPDGVDGISHSDAGSGVGAVNTAGGDGLFAQTQSGFAGFFLGDVAVHGNLSKSGGSFKIDHPLDPSNKYLYHSFVESPDMMNIYNGNVTTDAQGRAMVQMPEWFESLNRDFRYQLTVIGQFAQAIVASEMANHSFTIQTDKPNVKVSWQVTGIRQDAWANAHRIPVEQLKSEKERGLYLHPELFGAPLEKSIGAARHPGVMKLMKEGKTKLPDSTKQ